MRVLKARLGIELPVIQAPLAGVQDAELALAVSAAGGLGSLPCAMLSPETLKSQLARVAAATSRPVNLNFFCHVMREPDAAAERRWRDVLAPYYREFGVDPPEPSIEGVRRPIDDETLDLLEPFRPKVVSFHFGLPPDRLLHRIKSWGALVLSSATTVDEGRWLERRGADVVIAQGIEAGGHRGHFLSDDLSLQPTTRALVAGLRQSIALPIVAAGGIGSRDEVVEMLELGADAVQVGSAYLACPEATTPAVHRAALLDGGHGETALTNLFSGRPARGIMNRLMRDLGPLSDLPPAFPWASQALAPLRAKAETLGRGDFSPLWAGTNTQACRETSAALVTRSLAGLD